jgi:hypothetical protein
MCIYAILPPSEGGGGPKGRRGKSLLFMAAPLRRLRRHLSHRERIFKAHGFSTSRENSLSYWEGSRSVRTTSGGLCF